jgi:hypothetical protein
MDERGENGDEFKRGFKLFQIVSGGFRWFEEEV